MLNGTFIIQAGNFLCAYIILDVMLFRPVLAIIAQEDALVATKQSDVAHEAELRDEQEKKIQHLWIELKKEFGHKRPFFMHKAIISHMPKRPVFPEITKAELQHAVTHAVDVLAERCAHIRK